MNNTPESIAPAQDQIPADLSRLAEAIHGLPEASMLISLLLALILALRPAGLFPARG